MKIFFEMGKSFKMPARKCAAVLVFCCAFCAALATGNNANLPDVPLMTGAPASQQSTPPALSPQSFAQNIPQGAQTQEPEKKKVELPEIEGITDGLYAGFWETYWIEAFILTLLVLLILWLILRTKKKVPPTPYEITTGQLSSAPAIFDAEGAKKYAEAVSQLVRDYLEGEHNLPAPERTTEEFLEIFSESQKFDKAQRTRLEEILKLADLAKFAGLGFGENERDALLKNARDFVETDHIQIESKKSEKTEKSPDESKITNGDKITEINKK